MKGIEFYTNGHIVSEADSMRQKLGVLAKQYSATSAIIITDAGISELGYVDIAQQSLQEVGVNVVVFDSVVADPPIAVVESAIELARDNQCNLIIGLGAEALLIQQRLSPYIQTTFSPLTIFWIKILVVSKNCHYLPYRLLLVRAQSLPLSP
ncbi:hypothetical protein Psyaliredsea_24010 [Psychrobacter alimentarius]